MRLRALKWLMMSLASCGSIAFALATSPEAVACFGRCCGGGCGWGAGYRSYRPLYGCRSCGAGCSSGCVSGCAPCGSGCAPCGGLACSSGNCGVAPAEPIAPIAQPPNSNWDRSKRTYADPDATTTAPDASGAAARTETDKSIEQNTRKPEQDESALGIKQKVQKKRQSTDGAAAVDESSSEESKESAKRRKKGPEIADPEDDATARQVAPVPVVSIDEKVAWRPAPIRKRGEIHTGVASARLIRVPAYPKSEWLPSEGTNIAKK